MQRLRKYQQFAARCLQEARSTTDPRLKAFWAEMAQEWQRLVDERKGTKSEHTHFRRHEVDPGD
jgi:hypothetical protein